jgi:hypothetical protein
MKLEWKMTRPERRVQEFARHRASKQLLGVASVRFCRTQKEYLRWEAFSLWVRTIVETEDRLPSSLASALRKKCPGFVKTEKPLDSPTLLAVRLDEWICNRVFAHVKQEGWLDALLFYGARDLRSQRVWGYWEYCADQWSRSRPLRYPQFGSWFQSARTYELHPKLRVDRLAAAIEDYVDWFSFARWILPLLDQGLELPAHVAMEANRRLPGFVEAAATVARNKRKATTTIESRIMLWIENRHFSEANKENWLGSLRQQAQNDPRYVRVAAYADHSRTLLLRTHARAYPLFASWRRAAEHHIERNSRA